MIDDKFPRFVVEGGPGGFLVLDRKHGQYCVATCRDKDDAFLVAAALNLVIWSGVERP